MNKTIFESSGASWELLINCEGSYTSKLAKKIDITYSHTVKIIKKMERLGLLTISRREDNKRTSLIKLTEKGNEVKENLRNVKTIMGGN